MSLDLFSSNVDNAVNYAARVSAPEMPSTFSDNFNDAWNRGYLTSQSISGEIRKTTARQQIVDDAIAKTGDRSFEQSGEGGGFDQAGFNAKIAQHKAARPDLELQQISDEAIQAKADEIGIRQLSDSTSFARRERTTGGAVGSFLGTASAALTDPVNLIAFPLAAPESLGILGTALAWGGIGAGSQTAIEALNATSMERIQPGYGASNQPVTNILETALGGAVLGGGLKGLSMAWQRAKSGSWPRTVRDAGNVVDSEAQIAQTNPFVSASFDEGKVRSEIHQYFNSDGEGVELSAQAQSVFDKMPADIKQAGFDVISRGRGIKDAEDVLDQETISKLRAEQQPRNEADAKKFGDWLNANIRPSTNGNIAGEAVHRTALSKAIDDLANGRPVDVEGVVTPEQLAALDERTAPVMAAKDAAVEAQLAARAAAEEVLASSSKAPELPFVQTEAAANAEAKTASLTQGIQDIARLAGHEMSADEAAKIAARVAQLNDPDKARALLDEVFLRPQTISDTLPAVEKPVKPVRDAATPDTAAALRDDLTPGKIDEARTNPDMEETVSRDLDKLMLEKPDLEVPTGVTVDGEGRTVPTTRKVEDVVAEADSRLAAAKEIEACVGPYQMAAE